MITALKFLGIFFLLLILVYAFSPLYLPFIEKRVNKIYGRYDYEISKEARNLHSTLFIADLHGDPLFSYRKLLRNSATGHADIPRLIKGNIRLQVFGVPSFIPLFPNIERNAGKLGITGFLAFLQHWPVATWYSSKNRALYQAMKLHDLEEKSKGAVRVIKTSEQLKSYYQSSSGKRNTTAGILALEGAHVLDRISGDIDLLYERGFRIIGLVHLTDNKLGGSQHGAEKKGLTAFGKKAVQRMEERHMIIDLTHASSELMEDVLGICSRPVIVSHTGVKGCVDNNRNLSDQQIKAVANKGGLIGIGFWKEAVGEKGAEAIADTIKYTAKLVGIKHVALGSDFDGGVSIPFDAAGMVHLTEALLKAGFSEKDIRRVMGENAIDFLIRTLPEEE